jgi:hypothetical protein
MIDTNELQDRLTEKDLRSIFDRLGFEGLRGEEPNSKGWISGLHGPPALGEGSKGNFAVNLRHGGVRDHGDDGYSGDLIDAVRDVKHLEFQEALQWIGTEAGIDVGTFDEKTGSWDAGEGEVIDTYPYRTVDGELLFEQVREAPPANLDDPSRHKAFYPRVPEEGMGLHDRPKIPYRLPKWSAKGEDPPPYMTYHEGEKDVDNVWALGMPATTTPFGANSFELETAVEHFEGMHVAIFPDNDSEGESHAKDVAEALLGVAESVKIVRLDDRPADGGDVSDWIERKRAAGHDREELREILRDRIEEAKTYSVPENGRARAPEHIFWYVDTDEERVKIDRGDLLRFLRAEGFGKLYGESRLESSFVRVQNNIVRRTSTERMRDVVLRYVRDLPYESELPLESGKGSMRVHGGYDPQDVANALLRAPNVYFSEGLFKNLPPLELDFHKDTPEKAFFYYENGFVEVTAETFQLHPYEDLDGVIWEDQMIDRPFQDLTDESPEGWDWHEHLLNVAGRDPQRHNSVCTALGYLKHGYKDPAVTKAVIFMDEKVSDVEEGRTGKSLTSRALQETKSVLRLDGRNFSFESRFAFQEVRLDTEVVDFNDIREGFPFGRLFSVITDDMPVEPKGKQRYTIPFEDSPKFILSTNYVVEGEGASFEDRTFQIEFADYYSPDHTPEDEFGHRLFDDWGEEEWAQFDNVMMACVRQYLRDGLAGYEHVNVDYRRLQQQTSREFAQWALRFFEIGKEYDKDGAWRTFKEAYEPDYDELNKSTFGRWISTFARIYGLGKEERRPRREDGSRPRLITFTDDD